MNLAVPDARPGAGRLPGLDLARFIAVAGMVLVHARSDLTAHPETVAAPWLEAIQAVATNRARLLFFLLAGVGVALLVQRRGVGTALLLRRALFLAALGAALAVAGWSDLILVFYGLLFVVAVVLVRLSSTALLVLAPVAAAPGLLRLGFDPPTDDTLTNVLLLVGEIVPMFSLGLVIGRADLTDRAVARTVAGWGAALAAPGLGFLALTGGLDIAEVEGRLEPVAALSSTAGLCPVVLALCLRLPPGSPQQPTALIAAGRMPLTAYVGHALLFPILAGATDWGLELSTVVAFGYLVVLVVVAAPWIRWRGSGPLEALMRRVSGPFVLEGRAA